MLIATNSPDSQVRRLALTLILVAGMFFLLIAVCSASTGRKSKHHKSGAGEKLEATSTTSTTPEPEEGGPDSEEDEEDSASSTTTTTTTTARPKGSRKKHSSRHKKNMATKKPTKRPADEEEEEEEESKPGEKSPASKEATTSAAPKVDGEEKDEGEGESRAGLRGVPKRGGSLDEGSEAIAGGGFAGCGKAPLNQFTASGPGGYIINGLHIKYGEFPQYIHLETRFPNNMVGLCGGTLVSDRHVLTAAHCVKDKDTLIPTHQFSVIFGEDNMRARDAHELHVGVSHICVSTKYTHDNLRHDWALITLDRPVKFNNFIQPACLPNGNQLIHTYGPQSKCFLVGAGAIGQTPNRYDSSKPEAISSNVVNKLHTENVPCMVWGFGAIDQDRVCYTRANKLNGDSCVGDSGGPILCLDQQKRWTLMASVSYGATFCQHSMVAVYARTRTLLPEIQQTCGINLLH